MIQSCKDYQKDYFESEGFEISESLDNAVKLYCKIYKGVSEKNAKQRILDDTNGDWIVLNDGSVAVFPGLLPEDMGV